MCVVQLSACSVPTGGGPSVGPSERTVTEIFANEELSYPAGMQLMLEPAAYLVASRPRPHRVNVQLRGPTPADVELRAELRPAPRPAANARALQYLTL